MLAQPFTIHSINAYTHTGLSSLADHLELRPEHLQKMIRVMHHQVVTRLEAGGIDYAELQNALVPQRSRHEVAFMFDSTRVGSDMYGDALSRVWLPALRDHGPDKTVIRHGNILQLPNEFVWRELERHLVGAKDFPRGARELYYVVYLTNLSRGQLRSIDAAMKSASAAYLGYVDCSTWTPLKSGMFLPQIGLRLRDTVITDIDDGGTANQVGYPLEEYGFRVLGVDEELYGPLLGHRLDNGVPEWADNDTAIALSVLGGERQPVTSMNVIINESRIEYLGRDHAPPLHDAGLAGLDRDALAAAIKDKFANGLIYRLRFVEGFREGVLIPALDAMMFTVQVDFPDQTGAPKRYQVGMKYLTEDHTGEIVTFY
ncbi:hypothetical protein RF640_17905 [Kocuria sp. CPCC 205231]|uniref:hypothetical protein n=1 Tax=Kocuria sp. CPCC 205231 TaxID=3073551 RepID=UPI0034D670AA